MADDWRQGTFRAIGDHGVIGDQRTVALVACDGSVDYLCWPHMDSPSIFAALLDSDAAGVFTLAPTWSGARNLQIYLPDSNILQTRWLDEAGVAEITDFMPVSADIDTPPRLIRRAHAVKGEITFRARCAPRLDYARADTHAEPSDDASVLFSAEGLRSMRLASDIPLQLDDECAVAEFTLKEGESALFVLGGAEDEHVCVDGCDTCFTETRAYWRRWVKQSTYSGRWREMVNRSALILKLLTSRKHGSIAAAATFGLPETMGGERNWDYRASWIRDASFTVYAFMRLGYTDEGRDFMKWVGGKVEESSENPDHLQIMYGLDGTSQLDEQILDHLSGHGGSRPVRIGNEAFKQSQLDIYGELMDAVYLSNKYGDAISRRGWLHVTHMVNHVCEHWNEADAGIWEMRGDPQHFLHSRLMCWVAVDRALRLGLKRSLPMPYERWDSVRTAINNDIWDNFWNEELGYFTATRGGRSLDASMLLMPLVRFVSAKDPCWLQTLDAIGHHLVHDGLVRRYLPEDTPSDALQGEEGAFAACSFWYVECLARAGRIELAQMEFEKLLNYANHLGIYAEQFDKRGVHLGNTPQALTHLALISAAFFLDRRLAGGNPQWQP